MSVLCFFNSMMSLLLLSLGRAKTANYTGDQGEEEVVGSVDGDGGEGEEEGGCKEGEGGKGR